MRAHESIFQKYLKLLKFARVGIESIVRIERGSGGPAKGLCD